MLNSFLQSIKSKQHNSEKQEEEFVSLSITPDIIIHNRKNNKDNLLIIEMKKSTNNDKDALRFDEEKLVAYTQGETLSSGKREFLYDYGLLLIVGCLKQSCNHQLIWFENGIAAPIETFP